jgi:hypothetical protein
VEGIRTVSVKKVVFKDYASFSLLILCLILLVSIVGIPLLLIPIPLLVRRVRKIRNAVENGMLVNGTVVKTDSSQSTKTTWYTYLVQGEEYTTKNWTMYYAKKYKVNDALEIAYSMEDPSVAFPAELYVADTPTSY